MTLKKLFETAKSKPWFLQIQYLYEHKDKLDQNPKCAVCGVNNFEQIKSAKGTYYSVTHTDYQGHEVIGGGFFSSYRYYQLDQSKTYEKRLKHHNYYCSNCQTYFERIDDFDLLSFLNGFDTKKIEIIDTVKYYEEIAELLLREEGVVDHVAQATQLNIIERLLRSKDLTKKQMIQEYQKILEEYKNSYIVNYIIQN